MDCHKVPAPSQKIYNPATNESVLVYASPGYCKPGRKLCADCENQYYSEFTQLYEGRRYAHAISNPDAAKAAAAYVEQIKDDRSYLLEKVASRGDTIINRWNKKNHEKRSAVLTKAFPNMCSVPMFLAHFAYDWSSQQRAKQTPEALLLLHVDLETLTKDPMKFLALLHCRSYYDPEQWIPFDRLQTGWYWSFGEIEFASCSVILRGQDYGKIVPWDEDQAHRGDIAGFPRVILILETQSILMTFLKNVVQHLLEGVDGDGPTTKWATLVEAGFSRQGGSGIWSSYMNQGFSAPIFNIDRIHDLSTSRLAEGEDHLWLLQTDPAYFQRMVKNNSQGRLCEIFGGHWSENASVMLSMGPVYRVKLWRRIVEEVEHVRAQHLKFGDKTQLGQPLPPDLESALACLNLLTSCALIRSTRELRISLLSFTAFRDFYELGERDDPSRLTQINTKTCGDLREIFYKDPLHWCMHKLSMDPTDTMFDPAAIFAFLENWLGNPTTTKKERSRLEQPLLEELSDIAALHEIHTAIIYHRPRCKVTSLDKMRATGHRAFRDIRELSYLFQKKDEQDLGELQKAFEKTPFPKGRRDRNWLRQADEVRQNSKKFWAKASQMFQVHLKKNKRTRQEDLEEAQALMSYDSAPEYLEELQVESDFILAPKIQAPADTINNIQTLSNSSIPQPAVVPAQSKTKVKTRPAGTDPAERDTESSAAIEEPTLRAPVKVKQESLPILMSMYPTATEICNEKPSDWIRFVRVMQDAKFSISHSGGSAVTFAKAGEGRIVFHKPHPVANIDSIMLQWMGKRLRRWFGWDRDTFEIAKDEDKVEDTLGFC